MSERPNDRSLVFRTSNKLALQYSILYSILLVLVLAISYFVSWFELTEWALDWMRDDAVSFQTILESGGEESLKLAVQNAADINAEKSKLYGLFTQDREYLSGSIPMLPFDESASATYDQLGLDLSGEGEHQSYWIRIDRVGEFLVAQGTSNNVISELLQAFGLSLLIGFILLLALGLFLGRRVGRITEDRVAAISNTLDAAAGGDFAARINPHPRGDDLWLVESKIDGTLAQLSSTVDAQKQVSVDIAHDLRSPLQRVRQNIELLLEGPGFEINRSRALQAIDELNSTFQSLLEISGLSGANRINPGPVDVRELVQFIEELYLPDASDAGIRFRSVVDPQIEVISGDRNLLAQMIGNLIENSLKYCGTGDEVTLRIVVRPDRIYLRVEDTGPGIPPDHAERVFNRFHRVDPSRNSPGVGLGLALVRAIAEAHGGSAKLIPAKVGTIIEVAGLKRWV